MRNSTFVADSEEEDKISVRVWSDGQARLEIGNCNIFVSTKQLLDLGMKIQKVISEIDRENRPLEKTVAKVADDRRRDEFKRGDPGHPDNEMGM